MRSSIAPAVPFTPTVWRATSLPARMINRVEDDWLRVPATVTVARIR